MVEWLLAWRRYQALPINKQGSFSLTKKKMELIKNSHTIASISSPSTMDLVCHYQFKDGSSQFIFLQIDKETRGMHINHSLSFSTKDYVQIVSSCNGLLLLSSVGEKQLNYHVFNPLSKETDTLPQTCINRHVIGSGLAFDGQYYHVVLVHVARIEKKAGAPFGGDLGMEIFSSKTEKWRTYHPKNLSLPLPKPPQIAQWSDPRFSPSRSPIRVPNLPDARGLRVVARIRGLLNYRVLNDKLGNWGSSSSKKREKKFEYPELSTRSLYSNGAIYWEISGHLLVYRIKDNHCKLIELPNLSQDWCQQSKMTYQRCLWESEGRVHYSYTDFDGVHIWDLLKEEDHDYYFSIYDREKFSWRLAHSVQPQNFISEHPKIFEPLSNWEPYNVAALAYAEASQTMYMHLPGFVLSYDTKTCMLEKVCTYKYPDMNFSCCSFFPYTHSGQCSLKTVSEANEPLEVVKLPMTEVVNSLSFM